MTKQKNKNVVLSATEKGALILSIIVMIGTILFTYVFFLLPLLTLPIILLIILVLARVIRNPIAVRTIEILAALGVISSIWLVGILFNYLTG